VALRRSWAYQGSTLKTVREASKLLGISEDAIRMAIMRGVLKAVKFGRDWAIEEAEVERYAKENRRK
jgi:excisionase family DNA binding protein